MNIELVDYQEQGETQTIAPNNRPLDVMMMSCIELH